MVSKHKLSEFILKEGDLKLVIRNQGVATDAPAPLVQQPVSAAPALAPAAPALAPAALAAPLTAPALPAAAPAFDEDNNPRYRHIKSPMVGTFYRSNSPDKPAFIKIGDSVDVGSKVCIIEAMKLFNEIESELKGKIVKVLVEDASPVEYDQPLFLIDPT